MSSSRTSSGDSKNEPPIVTVLTVVFALLAICVLWLTWEPLAAMTLEVLMLLMVMAGIFLSILFVCAGRIVRYMRAAVHADSKKDLRAEIADVRAIVGLRGILNKNHNPCIALGCDALLDQSTHECDVGYVNVGWRILVQAKLQSLHLLAPNDPQIAPLASDTLARSYNELDDSRLIAVRNILEDPRKQRKARQGISVDELCEANRILEGHINERFDSLDRAAWQLYILCAAALVCIVAAVLLLPSLSTSTPLSLQEDRRLVPLIAIIGALGGSTGGFFLVLNLLIVKKGRSEETMTSWMIAIRPLIGAVFALAVSLFLLSGFLNVGMVTLEVLLSVCFIAGFSENFVINLVNTVVDTLLEKKTATGEGATYSQMVKETDSETQSQSPPRSEEAVAGPPLSAETT